MTGLLWLSLVLLVLSGLTALGYELIALFTRQVPTITDIVRNWEAAPGLNRFAFSALFIGITMGIVGLGVHFLGGF